MGGRGRCLSSARVCGFGRGTLTTHYNVLPSNEGPTASLDPTHLLCISLLSRVRCQAPCKGWRKGGGGLGLTYARCVLSFGSEHAVIREVIRGGLEPMGGHPHRHQRHRQGERGRGHASWLRGSSSASERAFAQLWLKPLERTHARSPPQPSEGPSTHLK